MLNLNVRITFFQPFRLIPRVDNNERHTNRIYLRGGTFARWHQEKKEIGKPYITGTLLRSALFAEIEKIRILHSDVVRCCSTIDTTNGNMQPSFLRKRPVYIEKKHMQACNKCPLCHIMGRGDDRGKDLKKKKHYDGNHHHNWTVHFSNFDTQTTFYWEDIVQNRIVNRVDQTCGKAKDYFRIWEVDHIACPALSGIIRINDQILSQEDISKVKQLMAVGLAQIETLAGAICRIDITNENHNDLIKTFFEAEPSVIVQPKLSAPGGERYDLAKLDKLAEYLTQNFETDQKEQQLRRLADAIRDLRQYPPNYLNDLPVGKTTDRATIWNKKIQGHLTLKECLENQQIPNDLWRQFCEGLGHEIYNLSKNISNRSDAKPRLLGETEYAGLPLRKAEEKDHDHIMQNKNSLPETKWIITGQLKAETPFFIGHENEITHTRSTIQLNLNGQFTIPRSTLRGALRRDLRLVFGDSCNMPVGSKVCFCPVCQLMRCIKFDDATSDFNAPPEVRHRIRLNCHTGIVEEGALFDMETGFQGMIFPFRLYHESKNEIMQRHLWEVLNYWKNGQAFFGGEAGTGFGRFKLINTDVFLWEIDSEEEAYLQYLFSRGFRGIKTEEIKKTVKPDQKSWESRCVQLEIPTEKIPLTQINYSLSVESPLISRDPIAAMLDTRSPDAVMVKKTILEYGPEKASHTDEPKERTQYFIKSETIRGLLRSIISKTEITLEGKKERLFNLDHEDCDCLQCRLFGNVHQQGLLRFEDAEVTNSDVSDSCIDHVAIDRFTGGGVEKMKFNDYPLSASQKKHLHLKGVIWVTSTLKSSEKAALASALAELKYGYASLGGLSAIGYGRVKELTLEENEIIQLPEITETSIDCQSRVSLKPDPKIELNNDHFYYPHYFIKPAAKEVVRESQLISHVQDKDTEGHPLLTGKIKCRLQTLGPLFIADSEKGDDYFKVQHQGFKHLNFAFFRMNDHIAIPGASIRGMISSVFEALTHSCFRVMDDKKYLTRRLIPESETTQKRKSDHYQNEESDQDLFAGRVEVRDDKYYIVQMDEIVRLPLYDNVSVVESIREYHYSEECASYLPSAKKAINYNRMLAKAADSNRDFLCDHPGAKEILQGKKEIYYTIQKQEFRNRYGKAKEVNEHARYACLTDKKTPGSKKGFIKYTGPDMVTVNKEYKNSDAPHYNTEWENDIPDWERSNQTPNHQYQFILHNDIEMRSSQKKKYPRPVFTCIKDGVEYRMQKRCERIFASTEDDPKEFVIPQKVVSQYNTILEDNKENTETIPKLFTSKMVNKTLSDGDLVYFKYKDDVVTDLAPVAISRKTDKKPMGKRFPKIEINGQMQPNDSLRSCSHTCTEDCDECPNLCDNVKDFFKPHPEGLCPACHLFGTTYYKGRLSFGMAWLENVPNWYCKKALQQNDSDKEQGGQLTLPLLERPRPTWSMPHNEADVPGRKFYVHHPWSVDHIQNNQGDHQNSLKSESDEIKMTENNRTIEPLGKDNYFTFEIHFKHLRDWELGLLLYSIELEKHLAHKLGMAKAFGMGSVRIEIQDLLIKGSINEMSKLELIQKGFQQLGINSIENDDLAQHVHIKQLREVLWFPEKFIGTIKYPDLESKSKAGKIPTYTDFVQEKNPETGQKNPRYQPLASRLQILQNPWNAWWKN